MRKNKKRGGIAVRGGEGKKKRLRFSMFQQSEVVSPRIKVGPRNESYAWVSKTASFIAFQMVGVSPTLVISCLVAR